MKNCCKKVLCYLLICVLLISSSGNTVCAMTKTAAPASDVQTLLDKGCNGARAFLKREYTGDYLYGYEWIIFTMLRAGEDVSQVQMNIYCNSVFQEIKTWKTTKKPTEIARVALTLSVMGKEITDIGGVNLAALLYNNSRLGEGSNELTYALLALDAKQTIIPAGAKWTRESMLEALLSFQNEDGGFALKKSGNSGIDTTAMALQAMSVYETKNAKVKQAIEKAVSYLQKEQDAECGFGTAEATAQVLIALCSLKRNALDSEKGFGDITCNLITNLNQYYIENPSGFLHEQEKTKPDSMATIQVFQAYTAYERYLEGKSTYWDMTDVTVDLVQSPKVKLNVTRGKLQIKKSTTALKVSEKLPGDEVVKWTSSNKKVAAVTKSGKITAKKAGAATIQVTMKSGATAKCRVTVQNKKVSSKIRLTKKSYCLKVKDTATLKYALSNGFDEIKSFKSSNGKVVTVSKKGVLKGKKAGTAKVTIRTKNGAKAVVKVAVKKK